MRKELVDLQNAKVKKPRILSVEQLSPVLSAQQSLGTGPQLTNAVTSNANTTRNESNESNKKKEKRDLNNSIKIEVNRKSNTKHDYRLTPKVKYEHFYEFLSSELRTMGLLYVIDSNEEPPTGLNDKDRETHKFDVRDIIINRIDQTYHSKVLSIRDPVKILESLKNFKQCEVNVTSVSVRKQLYAITYNPTRETAMQFWDRFEEIIRNYENMPNTNPLSDDEKRDAFYSAVVEQVPLIQTADLLNISQTGKGLSYEMIKMYITKAEADRVSATKANHPTRRVNDGASVSFVNTKASSTDLCYECNDLGHWRKDCRLLGKGKKKCYNCNQFTNHLAAECRRINGDLRGQNYRGKNSDRYLHANNKRSFKSRGNNRFRNQYNNQKQSNRNSQNPEWHGSTKSNNESLQTNSRGGGNSRGGYLRGRRNRRGRGGQQRSGQQNQQPKVNLAQIQEPNDSGESKENSYNDEIKIITYYSNEQTTDKTNVLDLDKTTEFETEPFIADSGASEHMTKTKEIFQELDESIQTIIKCANKKSGADFMGEGKGTIYVMTNDSNGKSLKLDNVIYSSSLSGNLLSLRHFAESGYKIILDDEEIEIIDKQTNETVLNGIYDSPCWVIEFEIEKEKNRDKMDDKTIRIKRILNTIVETIKENNDDASNEPKKVDNKIPETKETQNKTIENILKDDGENSQVNNSSEQKTEVVKEPQNKNENKNEISEQMFSKFDTSVNDRKITDIDELPTIDDFTGDSSFSKTYSDFVKTNKAMLWHVRMGHASVSYLRKLQNL